ncbi:uncharacterized protein A4U43_C04F25140 [Asparagus officinalis]|uniref:Pentatricopeptide repeat-containing protein n=3 Tax=Asparagus officinalis TaxID=4686 RepID=A0A5P1F699_ASPOF|nr:uncharacterized protein A4U43_C04F25140 [Asparagus officinalis]
MLEDNVQPNLVTLLSIIRDCSLTGEHQNFGCVHGWVLKLGLVSASALPNSLAEMYSKNGFVNEGLKIMTSTGVECLDPDAIAALIHGCTVSGSFSCGEQLHGLLMKSGFFPCVIIENSLIDFYAKNERVSSANSIFNQMESRDIVSWNTMISCFIKNDRAFEALEHLTELHSINRGDLAPDSISILCSIQACSELANLQQGKILHAYSIKSGFNSDIFICNALIDMYAKSGRLDFAKQVFKDADPKDIGSWNSMIQAYGIHGDGRSALNLFTQLKKLGQRTPNAITFTNIISACSHSGLTKEGINCFDMMQTEYNIKPNMDHYGCMVDLLGRSGKLEEAEKFIDNMPIDASSDVWGALLGACGVFGHVEIAERAAEKLAVLEPDGLVWRVALSNVYANARRWVDVGSLRKEMKRGGWTKEAGWSLVEVEGKGRFKFVVGDTRHFESERIYEVWRSFKEHSIDVH